ncbi:MAG: helix-turn-helix domain-containing protein [Sedimenticola sp.]
MPNIDGGEVMTIEELSSYLKIPKSTLYKLAQEGKLPGQKIGKQWRFGKRAIDYWINDDLPGGKTPRV